jgi:hypothetical protein
MKRNEREDEGFEILNKIVENPKTFWVCRFGHIY